MPVLSKMLSSMASVIPGHQFRRGVSSEPTGDALVLQIKDIPLSGISQSDEIDWNLLERVDGSRVRDDCFAKKDDILFVCRGTNNFSFHLKSELPKAIVPNYFFIIRVHDQSLNPSFLNWFLQQKPARRQIERIRLGTSVSMISREGISEIEVPLPPLEKQKQIFEFGLLTQRELTLLNRINTRRYELTQQMLIDNTITAGAHR
jgi:hypothetical protein